MVRDTRELTAVQPFIGCMIIVKSVHYSVFPFSSCTNKSMILYVKNTVNYHVHIWNSKLSLLVISFRHSNFLSFFILLSISQILPIASFCMGLQMWVCCFIFVLCVYVCVCMYVFFFSFLNGWGGIKRWIMLWEM